MSRALLNFLLDTLLLGSFTCLTVVSLIVRFVFPPGTQADGWSIWSWSYDMWVGAWFNFFATFALLVLFHVMLHWSWVCGVVGQRLSKRLGRLVRVDEANQTVYGVGLLVMLLLLTGFVVGAATLAIKNELDVAPTTATSTAGATAP